VTVSHAEMTATADRILDTARTFAVVGASPRSHRPSYGVMRALLDHGYEVVPVTPKADEIHGRRAYPSLADIPDDITIDVVDIFRRSSLAGGHVDEAIALGVGAVWLQIGVIDEDAAARARAAGLDVVMDRCPKVELGRRAARR
jgi:uncharacterized protein